MEALSIINFSQSDIRSYFSLWIGQRIQASDGTIITQPFQLQFTTVAGESNQWLCALMGCLILRHSFTDFSLTLTYTFFTYTNETVEFVFVQTCTDIPNHRDDCIWLCLMHLCDGILMNGIHWKGEKAHPRLHNALRGGKKKKRKAKQGQIHKFFRHNNLSFH